MSRQAPQTVTLVASAGRKACRTRSAAVPDSWSRSMIASVKASVDRSVMDAATITVGIAATNACAARPRRAS
jgi:hypothetical protein